MVQVIQLHPYKESYPFGLQKQSPCTYVQLIKQLTSQQQLFTYRQNLSLFKLISSDLIILLDSYVKEGNTLQLYYEYEPLSIKGYIEQKLIGMREVGIREKFLTRIITAINVSIEEVIVLLMGRKMLALLSIENMAVGKGEKIKFFIEPDFEYVQSPTQDQLSEYYSTEKKKLQIQLEEFLQHIFSHTNAKPKDNTKANFVIQGTRLVFVNSDDEVNRQSSMSGVSVLSLPTQPKQQIKLPAYMLKEPKQPKQAKQHTIDSQTNTNNSSKQKFDIKNILDEKKLQKNQSHFSNTNQTKDFHPTFTENTIFERSPTKNCLTQQSYNEDSKKQKQLSRQSRQKDVKNYFENNDDFNKDASFYPEQFIKEDSIAEFDGYEDELEKELEDLKNKKYEAEQISNTSKNRLSMIPNTPINPQLGQQKMNKTPTSQQTLLTTKPTSVNPQTVLNSSDSREQQNSQEQQKQKKKYKVTITTSHLVDVDDADADLKGIEQELIEDIKNGTIKATNEGKTQVVMGQRQKEGGLVNFPAHMLKGYNRETRNPNEAQTFQQSPQQKLSSSNSFPSNKSLDEHSSGQEQIAKQLPQTTQQSSQQPFYSPSSNGLPQNLNTTSINQQTPDIKKIIEKIKSNSQNHQFINSTNSLVGGSNNNGNANGMSNSLQNSTIPNKISQSPQKHINQQTFMQQSRPTLQSHQEQEIRPQSQVSNQGNNSSTGTTALNMQKKQQQQNEKEYLDKIHKAKLKAEQIMKLVKERKTQ